MTAREASALLERADMWDRHAAACEESAASYKARGDEVSTEIFESLARARRECATELRADVAKLRGGAR